MSFREVVDTCLCLHLRQAARVVTQRLDDALRSTGLRTTQFTVLAVLAEEGAVPVTQLAEVIVADRTTLTRVLDRLEEQGFLSRKEGKDDRRSRTVVLTASGKSAVKKAYPKWRKAHAELANELGSGRVKKLLAELDVVSHPAPEAKPGATRSKPARKKAKKRTTKKKATAKRTKRGKTKR